MSGGEAESVDPPASVPMRPRRALLRALLALYVLWMAALAGLWYATVYAPRKAGPATQQSGTGESGWDRPGSGESGAGAR